MWRVSAQPRMGTHSGPLLLWVSDPMRLDCLGLWGSDSEQVLAEPMIDTQVQDFLFNRENHTKVPPT